MNLKNTILQFGGEISSLNIKQERIKQNTKVKLKVHTIRKKAQRSKKTSIEEVKGILTAKGLEDGD